MSTHAHTHKHTHADLQVLFTEHTGSEGKLPEKARAIMEAAVSTAISHPNLVSIPTSNEYFGVCFLWRRLLFMEAAVSTAISSGEKL
eukprot:1161295-Pelagomonas_calceolata.AAC.6